MAVDLSDTDSEEPERFPIEDPPYEQVRKAARGQRKDYRLDREPIAHGGQAVVFRGVHKATQVPIALKKLVVAHNRSAVARMRREIEASRKFASHPHVMPVLDADAQHTWFVMPLADGTAQTLAEELAEPTRLRELVTAVCLALQEPHRVGWVHRDLKPDNVLLLGGRWMVADWGLGRRPRGQTSDPRRTAAGIQFGTVGFAAPELSVDAHDAGPQADVYSIGQIIGWALTRQWPQANIPLLPEPGPWRRIVQDATAFGKNQHRRPVDAEALLTLVTAELNTQAEPVIERAKGLLADPNTAGALLSLVAGAGANRDLFHQVLFMLDDEQLRTILAADPASAQQVLQAAQSLPEEEPTGVWLLKVARIAESLAEWDVLREAAESILRLDRPADAVRNWLVSLSGEAASAAATALREHAAPFRDLVHVSGLDHRIVNALRAKPRPQSPDDAEHAPEHKQLPWPMRRWKIVVAATITAAAATIVPIVLNQTSNSNTPSNPSGTSNTNTSRVPSEVAGTPQLAAYVRGWDQYPAWMACGTAKETTVDGTFPAAAAAPALPARVVLSCDNGGNLTVMFGEFTSPRDYEAALDRYRSGPALRSPFEGEASPPAGVHVFQWSNTHRALMWTSGQLRTIGILITSSSSADLVEVWKKYQR